MYMNINIIASKVKGIKETYSDSPSIYINENYEFEISARVKELDKVNIDIDKFTEELNNYVEQQMAYMAEDDIDSALEVQYDISRVKKKLSELTGRKHQIKLKSKDYRATALEIREVLYEVNHR